MFCEHRALDNVPWHVTPNWRVNYFCLPEKKGSVVVHAWDLGSNDACIFEHARGVVVRGSQFSLIIIRVLLICFGWP